jgi:hypothetical protein
VVEVLRPPVHLKAFPAGIDLTNCFLDRLFEGTADSHNFTDGFHGRADLAVNLRRELGQIPLGNLRDDIVQRGFEAGGSGLGYSVGKFRQSVAESDLGRSVCQRIAGSLGSKSRRTRETTRRMSSSILCEEVKGIPSIDLNDAILPRVRAKSILDVTLANNAKVTDGLEGRATKHVVLIIGQSLGRCDDNGITSVRA